MHVRLKLWNEHWKTTHSHSRKGIIVVLAALAMVAVLAFAVFAIDVGYMTLTKSQLQNAADAAALAAANELSGMLDASQVETAARAAAVAAAAANKGGNQNSVFIKPENVEFGKRTWSNSTNKWTYEYGPQTAPYNIVKVTVKRVQPTAAQVAQGGLTKQDEGLPLFFAPVLGTDTANLVVTSVASFQPRDIMLALDFSGSMNDDSTLYSIPILGRTTVEGSMAQIWSDLGSPSYGSLALAPKYVTMTGQAASGQIPRITVQWKEKSVVVTSTLNLTNVRLKFSDGNTQTFSSLSGKTGTFQGTGSSANKVINTIWVKSGSNSSSDCSNCGEKFDYTNTTSIKAGLGLSSVAYPYASGSWDSYISYVNTDSNVNNAGYRRMFGGYTLLDYWLTSQAAYNQTNSLWKTRAQPVQSLKDGVAMLLDYMREAAGEDNIGVSIYDSTDGTAILETGLTSNLDNVQNIVKQRQAGHYEAYTNISAGMQKARLELINNSRSKAFRMMVLMTDGVANRPGSTSNAKAQVIVEANAAKTARIKILTISVGAGADTALMQQVADITGGQHFNVPGGTGIDRYADQLREVFGNIAVDRPLKLITDQAQ